jgi:hypothetical protein
MHHRNGIGVRNHGLHWIWLRGLGNDRCLQLSRTLAYVEPSGSSSSRLIGAGNPHGRPLASLETTTRLAPGTLGVRNVAPLRILARNLFELEFRSRMHRLSLFYR